MVSLIRSNTKTISEINWTDREYSLRYNADVAQKEVKMYCNTKQFPSLSFCGPNSKPHGARRLSVMVYVTFSIYHVTVLYVHQWYTNLGYMVYHKKQERYQPVTNFTIFCYFVSVSTCSFRVFICMQRINIIQVSMLNFIMFV